VPNDTLRRALSEARLSERELAERIGADAKTVGRWVADEARMPHPRLRWAVADALGVDEVVLWPAAARAALKVGPDREVAAVYPSHSAVPPAVWQHLVTGAKKEIVFADTVSYWYWWSVPDLTAILRERAEAGVRIRVIVGMSDDPVIRADEDATGVAMTLSSRIEQTLQLLEPIRDVIELRRTNDGFGRSVYRGDDEAVAHWWIHGTLGIEFPAMHLRRRQDGGIFDQIAVRHVEALWESAAPDRP
jgi:transcriptional regulator with XRE-family HTH domain